MISPDKSLRELAFIVCTALDEVGVTAVLSGGGAATIYAPDVYESRDLDFILGFSGGGAAQPVLNLGFVEHGGTYRHPSSPFTLEFPPGPLAIGDDLITKWDTLREEGQLLHVLSPTDSVRDRLMWFYQRVTDYSALEQALGVARRHSVDLDAIRDWSARERSANKFELFMSRLQAE